MVNGYSKNPNKPNSTKIRRQEPMPLAHCVDQFFSHKFLLQNIDKSTMQHYDISETIYITSSILPVFGKLFEFFE